ncbi:MAG TPA: hypothetical protein VM934_07115 [Pyrinomonadaceae bacterium]|jgi:cell division protein FtsW (lipid II flippase)|nr:hypothetical protein [Pyrinomonadaceae bacterium]
MWDRKRQIIWLATGVVLGTFFLYPLGHDETGRFDWNYFAQLEALLLLIIVVMFYVYSKKR